MKTLLGILLVTATLNSVTASAEALDVKSAEALAVKSASALTATSAEALSMPEEIQALNKDYGHSQAYPILILDKAAIKKYLSSLNLNARSAPQDVVKALMIYLDNTFNYKAEPADVFELLAYVIGQNSGASAMPFFVDNIHHKMKSCVVLPAEPLPDHQAEVKRILGADGQEELFKDLNLEEVGKLMSTAELQLFSLYHEMSHCLDQKYLPQMYDSETDPYAVHQAEAFAEINALLLLSQRKGFNQLGSPRSLIRTAYAKFYGPFLAQGTTPWTNPVVKWGGSTYFLAGPLMKAQEMITTDLNQVKVKLMSLPETIAASQNIIDTATMSRFGFEALQMSFSDGRDSTVAHYDMLAAKAPRLFGTPYQELQDALALMDSVQERISKYQRH